MRTPSQTLAPALRPERCRSSARGGPEFLYVGLAAFLMKFLFELSMLPDLVERYGVPMGLYLLIHPTLIASAMICFMLRRCLSDPDVMAAQPLRFFLIILVASTLAIFIVWAIDVLSGAGLYSIALKTAAAPGDARVLLRELCDDWCATVLWGSFIGWAGVMHIRYRATRQRRTLIAIRTFLLKGQISKSRAMLAARRIDARLVRLTLTQVDAGLDAHPAEALALFDRLVESLQAEVRPAPASADAERHAVELVAAYARLTGRLAGADVEAESCTSPSVAAPGEVPVPVLDMICVLRLLSCALRPDPGRDSRLAVTLSYGAAPGRRMRFVIGGAALSDNGTRDAERAAAASDAGLRLTFAAEPAAGGRGRR